MNTENFNSPEDNASTELGALFASARASQPSLRDDNFTKIVLNSLPRMPFVQDKVKLRKSFSFDLIGALLGLLCVYLFVDQTSIVSAVLSVIPESMVVSPVHVAGLAAAFMVTSIGAWWTFENVKL